MSRSVHTDPKREDIVTTLRFFGEACSYEVQSIELVASPAHPSHRLHLGKLLVPGRIILYPQPIGRWRLPGRLPVRVRNQLERAGAVIATAADGAQTQLTWPDEFPNTTMPACVTCDDLASDFAPRILFDNLSGAADVSGFSLPKDPCPAVVVGNERREISSAVRKLAHRAVQLPVASRKLNCLNVAATAAVAPYYLSRGGEGKMRTRSHPGKHRPELLLEGNPRDRSSSRFESAQSILSRSTCGAPSRALSAGQSSIWMRRIFVFYWKRAYQNAPPTGDLAQ